MNMMRKHLKPPGILMALILSLALAAFFVELNIAKDDSAEDSTVTKVTLNNGVDLIRT